MIKFFRKIRQDLLSKVKTGKPVGKYLKYAFGEIILVVIGILIALQINNWNEKSKLKNEEIKLLKEMRSALISDKEDIISNISEHSSSAKSCSILINHISNKLPYKDSLDFHFANALNTTRFGHTSSPYETLKIKGPDLIENDSLRIMLGEYYDRWVGYQFDLQKSSLETFNLAKERQFELFKSGRFWGKIKPVDYNQLVKNNYYYSWLTYTLGQRQWEAQRFKSLNEKNEQLINLIDNEVEKNN
ncbi:hypothetical protein K8354_04390 [Polaribacter litorisediminis]|uniref:DUF6090 family protein n=1 Tax=Polaribacter litorisediminis TaxID=1908341 RepID=UPI001CBB523D|nr:DUF6090 family protein [Polaribacter litorisediminis]UAM99069.1 hypothetical protein K8354_04390 [Polaribacter litorisediminis]